MVLAATAKYLQGMYTPVGVGGMLCYSSHVTDHTRVHQCFEGQKNVQSFPAKHLCKQAII
jgi:hypothetical protein